MLDAGRLAQGARPPKKERKQTGLTVPSPIPQAILAPEPRLVRRSRPLLRALLSAGELRLISSATLKHRVQNIPPVESESCQLLLLNLRMGLRIQCLGTAPIALELTRIGPAPHPPKPEYFAHVLGY